MIETSFFKSGLKFSCKRCSACCRHDSGYVFLSEKDLEKLASELNIDNNAFIKAYCRWAADWQGTQSLSLKEKSNYDCIFWNSGCTVYQARPLQCRTFPFWEAVLSSERAWETAAGACPGINQGALHSMEEITKCLTMRTTEPVINR